MSNLVKSKTGHESFYNCNKEIYSGWTPIIRYCAWLSFCNFKRTILRSL